MTPIQFAEQLADSEDICDRALGIAIVIRGLTDDDPKTGKAGWPMDEYTARAAAKHIGIDKPTVTLIDKALLLAPKLSDYILNKATS